MAIEVFCSTPVDLNDFYSGYMIDIVQSFSSCQSLKEISVFTYEVDLDGTEVTWEIEAVADKCVSETGMYPSFGRHLLHLNAREKKLALVTSRGNVQRCSLLCKVPAVLLLRIS